MCYRFHVSFYFTFFDSSFILAYLAAASSSHLHLNLLCEAAEISGCSQEHNHDKYPTCESTMESSAAKQNVQVAVRRFEVWRLIDSNSLPGSVCFQVEKWSFVQTPTEMWKLLPFSKCFSFLVQNFPDGSVEGEKKSDALGCIWWKKKIAKKTLFSCYQLNILTDWTAEPFQGSGS